MIVVDRSGSGRHWFRKEDFIFGMCGEQNKFRWSSREEQWEGKGNSSSIMSAKKKCVFYRACAASRSSAFHFKFPTIPFLTLSQVATIRNPELAKWTLNRKYKK
ncbi:hypothetical protein TNCV_3930691 [Trichonephila clavipes]|nr:hypothetical protein TNCV_3930691 [Trichonephila clavipes]